MQSMPDFVSPVVPTGRLRALAQRPLIVDELVLRAWQASDVPGVVLAYSDPDIQRWHGRSMTQDEARGWVASWAESWQAETAAVWAIADDRDELVGRVGLRSLNLREGFGEIAYWVLPAARGQTIAARAVRAVTTWIFGHVGLQRIELLHSTGNEASCHVAKRAGYRYEGTKRRQGLHADGWHDMHLHARIRGDEPHRTHERNENDGRTT